MIKLLCLLLVITPLFFGCKTTEQHYEEKGYTEVLGQELKQLISGKKISSESWVAQYSPDGKMSGEVLGKNISFNGTWEIGESGKLCVVSQNTYTNGCKRILLRNADGRVVWISNSGANEVKIGR